MMIKTGNLIIISIKTTVESIYIYILPNCSNMKSHTVQLKNLQLKDLHLKKLFLYFICFIFLENKKFNSLEQNNTVNLNCSKIGNLINNFHKKNEKQINNYLSTRISARCNLYRILQHSLELLIKSAWPIFTMISASCIRVLNG